MYKIKILYYRFKYSILNLFKFMKIIWNDRNWDYTYLYKLEKFKLQRILKEFESNKCYVEIDTRYLKIAIKLLDILLEEDMESKVYVNTKNISRFYNQKQIKFFNSCLLKKNEYKIIDVNLYNKNELRLCKIEYLYHKIRYYDTREWWY